jgi:hypothetical protein
MKKENNRWQAGTTRIGHQQPASAASREMPRSASAGLPHHPFTITNWTVKYCVNSFMAEYDTKTALQEI